MLRILLAILRDIIFPPYCAGCAKFGTFLCPRCYDQIHFLSLPVKLKLKANYLDHLIVAGNYEPPLSSLIHLYKYQGIKEIGQVLGRLLYYSTAIPTVTAITYVPLHRRRLKERGFNQAQLIAKELGRLTHTPCRELLTRTRYTTAQAAIADRSQRLTRLQECFALLPTNSLPTSVLLVDDVTTTGTTLNECAKVLKAAGVKKIIGLTLAHGS